MRHLIAVAFTLLAATAAAPASAQYYGGDGYRGNDYRSGRVRCESDDGRYRECPIGDGRATLDRASKDVVGGKIVAGFGLMTVAVPTSVCAAMVAVTTMATAVVMVKACAANPTMDATTGVLCPGVGVRNWYGRSPIVPASKGAVGGPITAAYG